MGQIPLSFPSVISPLAAADLFQIYSSRTEMRFWSNEHNPVYACRAVKKYSLPKSVFTSQPKPSHFGKRCRPSSMPLLFLRGTKGLRRLPSGCRERREAFRGWSEPPAGHSHHRDRDAPPRQRRAGRPTVWPARETGMLPALLTHGGSGKRRTGG